MSQVWRRWEVGNHKGFSLHTRLSSGTSGSTSYRSQNVAGRMIQWDLFWYRNNLKMKPTYREKNLLDYLFGWFRSTLKRTGAQSSIQTWMNRGCIQGIWIAWLPEVFCCVREGVVRWLSTGWVLDPVFVPEFRWKLLSVFCLCHSLFSL